MIHKSIKSCAFRRAARRLRRTVLWRLSGPAWLRGVLCRCPHVGRAWTKPSKPCTTHGGVRALTTSLKPNFGTSLIVVERKSRLKSLNFFRSICNVLSKGNKGLFYFSHKLLRPFSCLFLQKRSGTSMNSDINVTFGSL